MMKDSAGDKESNPASGPAGSQPNPHNDKGSDSVNLLRSAALQTSGAILAAQRRAQEELNRTKETLEQLRRQHQMILDSVSEGLHGISADGNIIFENPAAAAMLGWEARDMIGKHAHTLIHHSRSDGSPFPVADCPIYATLFDGVARHVEDEVFWRKDGTSFPVAYTSTPMCDETGTIAGTVVSFRDISERKRAEKAIQIYAEIVRSVPIGLSIWRLDQMDDERSLRLVHANPSASRLLGLDVQAMVGKTILEAFPAVAAREIKAFADVVRTGSGTKISDLYYGDERVKGSHWTVQAFLLPDRCVGIAFEDVGIRKQAEDRVRQIVEASPSGLVLMGCDGRIVTINKMIETLFGYSREELIGQAIELLVPERFRAAHPGHRQAFFTNPQTRSMGAGRDLFGRRKDGSEFPIEIGLNPMSTSQGPMVLSAIVDITERKQAETQILTLLAELHEAHHALEQRVRERTTDLAAVNESLREEISRRQQAEDVLVGDREVLSKIAESRPISEILETLARNIEAQTDGTLCSILLLDDDGIHLRHGAGPNLPEAYCRAIDGVAIGPSVGSCGTAAYLGTPVIVTDIATDPLWAPYSKLALAHGLRACWSAPIQSASARVLGTFAMYARKPSSPSEKQLATIDRATHLASIAIERKRHKAALIRANEDLESKVIERTAQLQAATVQAQAADRIKSAFLATMSHELRTPLNSIIGFTGIILQGLAGPLNPEQSKQLEMVRGSARHLLALINDVLDISKIEAGQLEVASERFDLRTSINKIVGIVAPLAEKKGLTLNVQIAPDLGQAVSDQRRLEQIVLNLLSNAIKFTEQGQVGLSVKRIADFKPRDSKAVLPAVQLSVADTGMGIKPEDLASLFQPFRQIDSGLSRNHEGTGLGLAICRRLADLMDGEIHAQSTWGKGSTFTFTLPLRPSDLLG